MERRKFIQGASVLGLASVTFKDAAASGEFNTRIISKKSGMQVNEDYDVIVTGGGPAGCAAAVAAAREGARTLLIERSGALGGMGTSGLLNAWCPFTDGEKIIYKGIAEKVFLEAKKGVPHVRGNDWAPINAEHLKVVYDDLILSQDVSVLFFSTVATVEMKHKDEIDAILVANKAGLTAYKAKLFIDCTGDGDLAAWSGAGYDLGDENEEVQEGTLCFTIANIDAYQYSLVALHGSNTKSPIHAIRQSGKYNLIKDDHLNDKVTGPSHLAFNAGHVTVNSLDPVSLSQAMMTGRKLARQMHEGLIEFAPKVFAASYLAGTGSLMGIRESRRIKCDYTFSIDDWLARRDFEDNIGRNSYYIDVHKENSKRYPRYNKGESHGIPYRCMTPVGLKNVLVAGRCISADHYAYGSLRVMPPCLVTGEAAGVAAGLIYKSNSPDVHAIDIKRLRTRLKEKGQLL
ncbi:MAG: FAD-dependent oxidoreductase [Tannerella sp.]|jgi:hypothetical protein|nr:FAD-dependent oxidoreductase [Tannerella sp.]